MLIVTLNVLLLLQNACHHLACFPVLVNDSHLQSNGGRNQKERLWSMSMGLWDNEHMGQWSNGTSGE